MVATIITIGDEILIGQVVDTNSGYMAAELAKIGIRTIKSCSISDNEQAILNALGSSIEESNIVLFTGGLGPTKDDITKHAFAKYFNCKLVRHLPTLQKVEERLRSFGVKMSEINRAQADVPEVCEIIENNSGSAPGMLFHKDDTVIISMPGVPFEMKDIMQNGVIPYLKSNYKLPYLKHKTFLTIGVPESTLSDKLNEFESALPGNFSLAYLPSPGKVRLRLSAEADNKDDIENHFGYQSQKLLEILQDNIFGYEEDTMEAVVGNLLQKNGLTVATAESCTGGTIAKLIASVPGASAYFKGSVVAYSNDVKQGILGVSEENLINYGAVSKQVVEQMAEGAKRKLQTDYGIATSGIAGPSGGTDEKPVGTVWVAVAGPKRTISFKYKFGTNRDRTVIVSSLFALNMLRKELLGVQ